jgi:hypothetical protein
MLTKASTDRTPIPGTPIRRRDLLAQLSPNCEHGPSDRRHFGSVEKQSFDSLTERQATHRARQHAEPT